MCNKRYALNKSTVPETLGVFGVLWCAEDTEFKKGICRDWHSKGRVFLSLLRNRYQEISDA